MDQKVVFRTSQIAKTIYILFFVLGILLVVIFLYNVFLRRPFNWVSATVSLTFSIFLLVQSINLIRKSWRYRFELTGNNTIKEYNQNGAERVIHFDKIDGIKKVHRFSVPMAIVNIFFSTPPHLVIYGKDTSGRGVTFEPAQPVSISKVILTLKQRIKDLQVDPSFASEVNIWHHRMLFGNINKWQLFLLIFLSTTLIGIPVLLVLYWLITGKLR